MNITDVPIWEKYTLTIEEAARCVGWLREAGVTSINFDLMYGLPHQTTANTLATIDAVLGLRPERLALFGYAHVPWMKSHQQLIAEDALPGPAERSAAISPVRSPPRSRPGSPPTAPNSRSTPRTAACCRRGRPSAAA